MHLKKNLRIISFFRTWVLPNCSLQSFNHVTIRRQLKSLESRLPVLTVGGVGDHLRDFYKREEGSLRSHNAFETRGSWWYLRPGVQNNQGDQRLFIPGWHAVDETLLHHQYPLSPLLLPEALPSSSKNSPLEPQSKSFCPTICRAMASLHLHSTPPPKKKWTESAPTSFISSSWAGAPNDGVDTMVPCSEMWRYLEAPNSKDGKRHSRFRDFVIKIWGLTSLTRS